MNSVDLASLVERHRDRLLQRALLWTGHHDIAWDLVQDTWERAISHFPASLPDDRAWPWLATVMRNRFMDQIRSAENRHKVRLGEQQWDRLATTEPDDEPDWRRFSEEDVRAGLYDLPESLRAPFTLHALEGLRYEEVAQRLGVRMGTVGTRIMRAKRILRDRLLEASEKAATPIRRTRFSRKLVVRRPARPARRPFAPSAPSVEALAA